MYGLNSFLLITLGAGFFALSFNKGRVGNLRQSIYFAVLACSAGLIKAIDDGVSPERFFLVACVYICLSLLGILVSRKLHDAANRSK